MAKKQNILWLIDGLGMGGAERLMVPYLRYLDKEQYNLRVAVLQVREGNPMAAKIEALGIPVDFISVPHLRTLNAVPRLWQYMREHDVDLVHTQLEFSNTLGTLAARMHGVPAVSTLHTFEEIGQSKRTMRHVRLMWAVLRRFNQRIVSVSEEVRQYHLEHARFAPQQVVTLYNGIDLSRFRGVEALGQDLLSGVPADAPVLLTVAVLRQPKGIQYMLEALPMIVTAVPQAIYLIVGDGEHGKALKALAQQIGVQEQVRFLGMRDDIPHLLASCDLFVLPTLLDALPTVLIEAMAASKATVATDVGGVPEIVVNGRTGLLIPPADPDKLAEACIQLLQDVKRREAMGDMGRAIAEQKFDIHKQVRALSDLYQELLA